MQITNYSGICTVYVDGIQVLQENEIISNGNYDIGITASTGDGYNFHAIKNIELLTTDLESTTIDSDKYCIHVVDENGEPIKGATVFWKDSSEVLSNSTNKNGNVYFPSFTRGTPEIDVSFANYIPWTNRDSDWEKGENRYSIVILYPGEYGKYKLSTAVYHNFEKGNSSDLLTHTKKINLKNIQNKSRKH